MEVGGGHRGRRQACYSKAHFTRLLGNMQHMLRVLSSMLPQVTAWGYTHTLWCALSLTPTETLTDKVLNPALAALRS